MDPRSWRGMPDWKIIEGDCRDVLRSLPASSVHTVVTSPPYFGLRDYGTEGQIGLEPTPDEFVTALVDVFREVRRVLRDDGTVWLNLGDSYNSRLDASHGGWNGSSEEPQVVDHRGPTNSWSGNVPGLAQKNLLGMPWRVAFGLQADGWILRSDIIWSKPNPMPESVTDRPTKAHEYVFLLSKGPKYHYDADAIREPQARLWDPAKNGDGPNFAGNLDSRNDPITQQGHRGTPSGASVRGVRGAVGAGG
jgi:DNA modification methylase